MECKYCHMRMAPFYICKKTGVQLKKEPEILGCNIDGKMTLPDGRVVVVGLPKPRETEVEK